MKQNNIHCPDGLDQTDDTLVRSRLRLAFIVFLAIVVFGQSNVFAADVMWNIAGITFKIDRPDLVQVDVQAATER